jgi:hypothetical protein
MEKDTNKGIESGNTDKKLKSHLFQKGNDPRRNLEGRPKGAKNFDTLFEEALKRIADTNSTTPDEFDRDIVAKGLEMARKGDYRFWKDLLDRRFGKALEKHELTGKDGKDLIQDTFTQQEKEDLLNLLNDKRSTN